MQLTISKTDLARVMTNVGRVVEARNTMPILGSVLLTATADRLTVAGTDLDILATASAEATVTAPGSVCVDARLLADIAKKAADSVSMSLDGDKLIVKSGRSKFTLATLPAADFPDMAPKPYDAEFELDIAALFAPVAFAMGVEQTRHYLCGVFLHVQSGILTAVATNAHQLGRHQIRLPSGAPDFDGIIIPSKMVSMLPKGVISFSVSPERIRVAAGDFTLVSKLVDGTYPDYQRVIPTTNDKIVTVDREALMKASDRVASISPERGRAVRLSVAPGSVSLSLRSTDNAAEDEVAADYSGEPIEIGFNSLYLRDLLSVLPNGPVIFALESNGSPGVVTSPANDNLTMVLMPVRI